MGTKHTCDWSEANVATLRKLSADGLSAAQIAKQIPGATRSSVLGKLYRMHVPLMSACAKTGRTPTVAKVGPRAPTVRSLAGTPFRGAGVSPKLEKAAGDAAARLVPAPMPVRIEGPGEATILTLGPRMCRWPIGDPLADDFTFCGTATIARYCDHHAALSRSPSTKPLGVAKLAHQMASVDQRGPVYRW